MPKTQTNNQQTSLQQIDSRYDELAVKYAEVVAENERLQEDNNNLRQQIHNLCLGSAGFFYPTP